MTDLWLRITLTAMIPVWIFIWSAAGNGFLNWSTSTRHRDAWWSTPAWIAIGVPGLFVMAGGIVFVVLLWVEAARP